MKVSEHPEHPMYSYRILFDNSEIRKLFYSRDMGAVASRTEYHLIGDIAQWLVDNNIDYCTSYFRPDLCFRTQSDYLAFKMAWM